MVELKTLKDIEIRRPKGIELPYLDWYKEELKQEAIKDIKSFRSGNTPLFEDGEDIDDSDVYSICEYIKWKFNIKESDLK